MLLCPSQCSMIQFLQVASRHAVSSIFNLPSYQHHPNPKRRKLERDLEPREPIEEVQLMESSPSSTSLSVDVST
ncbi:hypothetical protein ILUMI_06369 [Ignelater luminosus]|uniref:Uncharacterized protein n=1 Tax=Ignelater luminosus TaxID=2038154 RepID=A0A8K0GHU2_IGNLU|nr:hypothetical protein ILUMI_06369 [Ignelater luminosus]